MMPLSSRSLRFRVDAAVIRHESRRFKNIYGAVIWVMLLPCLFAQVQPAEIKDPQLKAFEQTYLQRLVALNLAISETKLPFAFSLSRYAGLDPKDQKASDPRGLEFVSFNGRNMLKISGNYSAAFNTDKLSANQRAGRVLNEVILPILGLLPDHFSEGAAFDAFGFEISYHVLRHTSSYKYEGKENLVVIFDKLDGLRYVGLSEDSRRQSILNASEIYLNGKPFGLALNMDTPFDIETLNRQPKAKAKQDSAAPVESPLHARNINLDALQEKYRSELEALGNEGMAKYHFIAYGRPSFVLFRNRPMLQMSLRNPETFDGSGSSIYRRAARTFDLFLAPQLKGILEKVPVSEDFDVVNITVVLDISTSNAPKSSEAIDFILPLKLARRFASADITNQELIDEGVVLVNGVRISLQLSQVE